MHPGNHIEHLSTIFPGADFSTLGSIGLIEAVRISTLLQELEVVTQADFALVISYALAFQRWHESSEMLNSLKDDVYFKGTNGFMQTHPAMLNEQKYFSIMRSSIRHLLQEIHLRMYQVPSEPKDEDELEEYLKKKLDKQGKDS